MTKDELYRVRKLGIAIKAKQMEANFLRDMAGKATSSITATRVSGTGRRSRVEDAVVELVDLEDEIGKQIAALKGERLRAAHEIDQLRNTDERAVMQMRYLACMKWDDIAGAVGCCTQHAYRIHGNALKNMRTKN